MDADEKLSLHRSHEEWNSTFDVAEASLTSFIQSIFAYLNVPWDSAIAVVLSDDAQVQEMNHDFRGKDKPTNVLSFPSDEEGECGDVIFAYETVLREAQEQGKSPQAHFSHLLLHGVLHLLGYDHIEDTQAEAMEALEIAILAQHSIANPYENR